MKKHLALFLALLLVTSLLAGCGDSASSQPQASSRPPASQEKPASQSQAASSASESAPEPPGDSIAATVDQYYANDNFMIEMLLSDSCVVEENGSNLMISTSEGHAAVILSLIPGIQNLSAAAALATQTIQNGIPGSALGEVMDGNLFGARAKLVSYEVADGSGNITLMGLEAAAIVNQSCYFLNMMMEPGMSDAEGELISTVFGSMNVLRPAQVNQNTKKAVYTSHYQQLLDSQTVRRSSQIKSQPVSEWSSLPYDYYSWLGDSGDYGDYPAWYYEPDWDYYSDPGDYWDWGWDDSEDWAFYDEYADYYSYDYYQGYDDYWDDYDPWSDPGDTEAYGYWDDDYDPWSDPGDTEAYGYEDDGYGDYVEEDGWGDEFE